MSSNLAEMSSNIWKLALVFKDLHHLNEHVFKPVLEFIDHHQPPVLEFIDHHQPPVLEFIDHLHDPTIEGFHCLCRGGSGVMPHPSMEFILGGVI